MPAQSLYLSRLLGSKVMDCSGARVGWVADAVVHPGGLLPAVSALVVRRAGSRSLRLPWSCVREVSAGVVALNTPADGIRESDLQEGDIFLAAEVLDKQLVDTYGRRVVKVNDLKLVCVRDELRVLGVDIGMRGILRRLGAEAATDRMIGIVRRSLPESVLPWQYVESIPARGANVRLSVPSSRLESLHPADISRIISQLPVENRAAAVEQFSDETLAETMGDLDSSTQVSLLAEMGNERASDILERMAPDEATDLLQDLPEERQAELLTLMEQDEAAELKELMRYDEHSAGGLMTTEFISIPAHLTAEEAIEQVRHCAPSAETIYYLYVVDDDGRLMGVLSLRSLITSPPDRPVAENITTAVVSVPADMDQEDVAAVIAKYRLLAVPVIGEDHKLLGIITVDDIIDVVDQEAEEDLSHIAGTPAEDIEELERSGLVALTRLPWVLLALVAGFAAADALHALTAQVFHNAVLFLPLLLLLGNQIAAHAAAATTRSIALHEVDRANWWKHSLTEVRGALPAALVAAVVAGLTASASFGWPLGAAVACSTAAVGIAAVVLGVVVPLLKTAVHLDPAKALRPIVVSLVAVVAPAIYVLFLRILVR